MCNECYRNPYDFNCIDCMINICEPCLSNHKGHRCKKTINIAKNSSTIVKSTLIPHISSRDNILPAIQAYVRTEAEALKSRLTDIKTLVLASGGKIDQSLVQQLMQSIRITQSLHLPDKHYTCTIKVLSQYMPDIKTRVNYQMDLSLYPSIVKTDGKIWIIGGCNALGMPGDSVFIVLDADLSRHQGENLKYRRAMAATVAFKSHVYVIGGTDANGEGLKSIEVFDEGTEMLNAELSLDMKYGRKKASACIFKGCIYVVGGGVANIEKLDIRTGEIHVISPSGLSSPLNIITEFGNSIYVFTNNALFAVEEPFQLRKVLDLEKCQRWAQNGCTKWDKGVYYYNYTASKFEKVNIQELSVDTQTISSKASFIIN